MRNAGGYATIVDPSDNVTEIDTFTCKHCNGVTHVKPKQSPDELGGLCRQCMGLVCSKCVGGGCDPFEEKLRREEARGIALRSYGVA